MRKSGDDERVVAVRRIAQARDLIFAIAAGGKLEDVALDGSADDEFGQLETMLNAFAAEFRAAKDEARLQEQQRLELIELQRRTIAVLSAPIVQVWDGVVTVPIVGPLDADRAQEMMARVLDRLQAGNDRCLIVDVTGLPEIDTPTAERLQRLISAVELIGVHCVITGIRGPVAQALVDLGAELTVPTLATLKDGLRASFRVLQGRTS